MQTGSITIGDHQVPFLYGVDCVQTITEAVTEHGAGAESVVFVADRTVLPHAQPMLSRLHRWVPVHQYLVDANEKQKRLAAVDSLLEYAVRKGADRNAVVIAMGGGLVGNIAGLAAALLYRGTRLIHLPTTPVAAFDSVLSLKQAVNLSAGKNLCGTYFPPSLIACDLSWLASIPEDQLLTGIAEMAKNVLAVVPDQEAEFTRAVSDLTTSPTESFRRLWRIGLAAKAPLLAADPHERRQALIFEYGHTVGHALVFLSDGTMGHGEAVAWGMLVAAEVSRMLGYLDEATVAWHRRVIAQLKLPAPATALARFEQHAVRGVLARDNKKGYLSGAQDEVPMVLLAAPGTPVPGTAGRPLSNVPEKVVIRALNTVRESVWWTND